MCAYNRAAFVIHAEPAILVAQVPASICLTNGHHLCRVHDILLYI
jgi:hypothetical protein